MWMLPLCLHFNQKSDDHCKDVQSQCPPQHCFSDIFTRTKQVIRFFISVQVQGQHPYPLPGSWLAAHIADLVQNLQVCLL